MVRDVFNLQVFRPSVAFWNTKLRSLFVLDQLLGVWVPQHWAENLILFPYRWRKGQHGSKSDTLKMGNSQKRGAKMGKQRERWALWESTQRGAGKWQREGRKITADACVETGWAVWKPGHCLSGITMVAKTAVAILWLSNFQRRRRWKKLHIHTASGKRQ